MHRARDRQAAEPNRPPSRSTVRLFRAVVLAGLLGVAHPACSSGELARPDLVLITLGGFPVDALACYGGDDDLGRDLCSVGEEGSRFVWAFAASVSPEPAVATLLTGLSPDDHHVGASAASFLPSGVTTLAEHLSDAGYETAAFVSDPALNRSRHFDQGFDRFDDGSVETGPDDAGGRPDAVSRAAQWLAVAPSPLFAWVHLGAEPRAASDGAQPVAPTDRLRRLERDLSRLLAVLDARPSPPAILSTGLPPRGAARALEPADTRVALLWRPPRVGGGHGVTRVIRTPVSQLDVAPTLLRASGLVDAAAALPGRPLPFRERRAGESGRTLEIRGQGRRALVGEGVYVVVDESGDALGVAQLPLAGERAPALGRADRSAELLSRIWAAPEEH